MKRHCKLSKNWNVVSFPGSLFNLTGGPGNEVAGNEVAGNEDSLILRLPKKDMGMRQVLLCMPAI